MTKRRRMKAELDSSSSSTMPTAYRTVYKMSIMVTAGGMRERTSEYEMCPCEELALEHQSAEGFLDNA